MDLKKYPSKPQLSQYISIALLDVAGIVLIGAQIKPAGWAVLAAAAIVAWWAKPGVRRLLWLLAGCLAVLGLLPISTDISYSHFLLMGSVMTALIIVPYMITHYMWHDHSIQFSRHYHSWRWPQYGYLASTAIISYLALPVLLQSTGSYLNWTVIPGVSPLITLFIGTNGLGIWDELFFIVVVLGILRHYLPFLWANIAQAVLFTSFLYELGFRSWCVVAVFGFALLQGYIFKRTQSLAFIIAIHLTVDFVLYLALINAHHPDWLPIFLT